MSVSETTTNIRTVTLSHTLTCSSGPDTTNVRLCIRRYTVCRVRLPDGGNHVSQQCITQLKKNSAHGCTNTKAFPHKH